MKNLRRLLILVMVLVIGTGMAEAEFRFGVKAGVAVNKLHFDSSVFDADNRTGFTGGVMTEFTIPIVNLGFDLSLMYTRMNSEVEVPSTVGNGYEVESVGKDFLQIPLNLKYKLNLPVVGSIIKPMIFTGPSFNFKLNKNTWEHMKTKTCQVAWNLGIGVELIKHLQISGSYAWGMNNVAKHLVNAQNIDLKNNYWTVTAAWLF